MLVCAPMRKVIYTIAQFLRTLGVTFGEETDARVIAMKQEIATLGSIQFEVELHADGAWTAVSTNVSGIITGSNSTSEMDSLIRDAIFTYYNIPPHLCVDGLLRADSEHVTPTHRIYA